MAGIGFELKKLFLDKSTIGYLRAYSYTAIVTTGPFVLMTSMVLIIQLMLYIFDTPYYDNQLFIASVVYPFIFSQVFSSSFAMLITRYIADKLYSRQFEDVLPSLFGVLALALAVAAVPAVLFFWNKPLSIEMKLATFVLYMELIVIWIEGVFLTALKDYKKIIQSYARGALIAVFLALAVLITRKTETILGVLLAMDIGVCFIATMLMVNIKRFFRQTSWRQYLFLPYLENHFSLFMTSLFYTVSLYVPNIMIWTGPLAVLVADTYVYAPVYDVATFYAFVSILPIMIVFVTFTELHFYNKYATYFQLITEKGNFKEIEDARADLLHVLWSELRNLIEFQLIFTIIFLALGNFLLPKIGLTYASLNMYNLLVLGAYCIGILQVIVTVLLYVEDRRGSVGITFLFLATNIAFNYVSLQLGENTYGFGFFLAAFISLAVALWRLRYFAKRIDYFVFCSQPVFSNMQPGFLTRFTNKLYPAKNL
ncbi:MAG: exopolysaccharide Pel transporter PelG [Negativicutes bacterium]|nr:exopolysaccharide Pel transporter PelG [Negativicutes bacterium]